MRESVACGVRACVCARARVCVCARYWMDGWMRACLRHEERHSQRGARRHHDTTRVRYEHRRRAEWCAARQHSPQRLRRLELTGISLPLPAGLARRLRRVWRAAKRAAVPRHGRAAALRRRGQQADAAGGGAAVQRRERLEDGHAARAAQRGGVRDELRRVDHDRTDARLLLHLRSTSGAMQ